MTKVLLPFSRRMPQAYHPMTKAHSQTKGGGAKTGHGGGGGRRSVAARAGLQFPPVRVRRNLRTNWHGQVWFPML